MQSITPFLWFNDNAEDAMNFYTSIFQNSQIGNVSRYDEAGAKASGRPVGSVMVGSFQLEGQEFTALNGGPVFTPTPAVSFFVSCTTVEEIDALWNKLSDGGNILMEFQKYSFSEKYGWCNDKFGVSWQLYMGDSAQKITPFLMFVGANAGKAEEAMKFYASVFTPHSGQSSVGKVSYYPAGMGEPETSVVHGDFMLNGQHLMAMDSSGPHAFTFTEANSFLVNCENQEEVDYFWSKLTEGGSESQCGWLKDKYGLSWQIVPTVLGKLLSDPDPVKSQRVMQAMLQMHKIDITTLQIAYKKE